MKEPTTIQDLVNLLRYLKSVTGVSCSVETSLSNEHGEDVPVYCVSIGGLVVTHGNSLSVASDEAENGWHRQKVEAV